MLTDYLESLQRNFVHLLGGLEARLLPATAPIDETEEDPTLVTQIRWQALRPGREGTRQTLVEMARLARLAIADPEFRQFVQSNFRDWVDLAVWTSEHFRYREEREEIIRDPKFMLQEMGTNDRGRIKGLEGDCDDIATFVAACTAILGYPSRFVALRVHSDSEEFEHVFSQANDHGEWITLDMTLGSGTPIDSVEEMIQTV